MMEKQLKINTDLIGMMGSFWQNNGDAIFRIM